MQLEISTRHGRLSDANQEKLHAKAEKLARFFERLTGIEVIVDVQDPAAASVEILVSAEHKHDFVAEHRDENLLTAMDAAVQKIEQQLRKYKERVQERHRNSDQRRQAPVREPED